MGWGGDGAVGFSSNPASELVLTGWKSKAAFLSGCQQILKIEFFPTETQNCETEKLNSRHAQTGHKKWLNKIFNNFDKLVVKFTWWSDVNAGLVLLIYFYLYWVSVAAQRMPCN